MFHNLHLIESPESVLLVASIIFFFSIVAGKAGFRFGLPALLLFLGDRYAGIEYYFVFGWHGHEGV